ncbi:MAG: hypothetical protein BMS9Abin05_0730 [Rhodothermia bacterium]|nr:MAG: hypothetical protein BMS9Abin05_0730 [Rhodothermia bacterium]
MAPVRWSHLILLTVLLSGCLPSSCNRTESRELFPQDSLSRALAASVPMDTLTVLDWIEVSEDLIMEYPRTLSYDAKDRLWVSDTELHLLIALGPDGSVEKRIDASDFKFPYIAGFRGDTVMVFSAGTSEIVKVVSGEAVGRIPVPVDGPSKGVFRYAAADEARVFIKVIADGSEGYIAELDDSGEVLNRWALGGPYWQYAGMLRIWGDSLISLSGFRPIIHLPSAADSVQVISLVGFDSPMLSRTRLFMLDELDQPPMLTASAVADGEFLFLLNMRPGWLRVDVYDHDGRLQYILTQPLPEFNQDYYPTDIAVRRISGNEFELAVSVIEPEPRIERYRWQRR